MHLIKIYTWICCYIVPKNKNIEAERSICYIGYLVVSRLCHGNIYILFIVNILRILWQKYSHKLNYGHYALVIRLELLIILENYSCSCLIFFHLNVKYNTTVHKKPLPRGKYSGSSKALQCCKIRAHTRCTMGRKRTRNVVVYSKRWDCLRTWPNSAYMHGINRRLQYCCIKKYRDNNNGTTHPLNTRPHFQSSRRWRRMAS